MISVIIPIYNSAKHLTKCLNSIVEQQYSEFEVILINDGSTDNSEDICMQYINTDNRFKYIKQDNAGPAKARNVGITKAIGDYITFVDSDDFIDKEYFENVTHFIEPEYEIIVTAIRQISNIGSKTLINDIPEERELNSDDIKKYFIMRYFNGNMSNIPTLCNKFYRNDFLKKHHLKIDENRVRAEDYWFNFDAFQKAKSIVYTNYAGYNYNTTVDGSIMKTVRKNQFELFLLSRNKLLDYSKTNRLKFDINEFNDRFFQNINEYILMIYQDKSFERKNKVIKEIISNSDFIEIVNNSVPTKLHTKLIKTLYKVGILFPIPIIYSIWAKKS